MVTARDVADFIVYIRDPDNNILYQEDFNYNVRKTEIPTELFRTQQQVAKEICIISKDSNGLTGNWFHAQCEKLPTLREQRSFFFFSSSNSASSSGQLSQLMVNVKVLLVVYNVFVIAFKVYL